MTEYENEQQDTKLYILKELECRIRRRIFKLRDPGNYTNMDDMPVMKELMRFSAEASILAHESVLGWIEQMKKGELI